MSTEQSDRELNLVEIARDDFEALLRVLAEVARLAEHGALVACPFCLTRGTTHATDCTGEVALRLKLALESAAIFGTGLAPLVELQDKLNALAGDMQARVAGDAHTHTCPRCQTQYGCADVLHTFLDTSPELPCEICRPAARAEALSA